MKKGGEQIGGKRYVYAAEVDENYGLKRNGVVIERAEVIGESPKRGLLLASRESALGYRQFAKVGSVSASPEEALSAWVLEAKESIKERQKQIAETERLIKLVEDGRATRAWEKKPHA